MDVSELRRRIRFVPAVGISAARVHRYQKISASFTKCPHGVSSPIHLDRFERPMTQICECVKPAKTSRTSPAIATNHRVPPGRTAGESCSDRLQPVSLTVRSGQRVRLIHWRHPIGTVAVRETRVNPPSTCPTPLFWRTNRLARTHRDRSAEGAAGAARTWATAGSPRPGPATRLPPWPPGPPTAPASPTRGRSDEASSYLSGREPDGALRISMAVACGALWMPMRKGDRGQSGGVFVGGAVPMLGVSGHRRWRCRSAFASLTVRSRSRVSACRATRRSRLCRRLLAARQWRQCA